ncbi:hypothetical protein V3851_25335 [Paenibacillus sp. M1]|uniref:Uncharacterized protein n=2 Tax=Paenibacillus haidiansis TaxID=1574488 RepID=A0ABU7VZC1_9BACL
MLFVKELPEEIREVTGRLTIWDEETDRALDRARLNLLLRMSSYVYSCAWVTRRPLIEKVSFFINNSFDYQKTAEKFGVSVKSLHVSISYASSQLKKRLYPALEHLREGNMGAAEEEFAKATGVPGANLFIKEIYDRCEPKAHSIDLASCGNELDFLSRYTYYGLSSELYSLNKQKLEHLLYVLSSNDIRSATERAVLFNCLEGYYDASKAMEVLADSRRPKFLKD